MPTETSITALNSGAPKHHHLDRRAGKLADEIAAGGDGDECFSTSVLAELTGLSTQFFDIGRVKGYGPAFVRFSQRYIRYRRSDVAAWLRERTHQSTAEYDTSATQGRSLGSKVVDGHVVMPDGDAPEAA